VIKVSLIKVCNSINLVQSALRNFFDKKLFSFNYDRFDEPCVILFSSFALFISITILFGFAVAFNDLNLRGNNSAKIGLYISPVSTPNIAEDKYYEFDTSAQQQLYARVEAYIEALYDLEKAKKRYSEKVAAIKLEPQLSKEAKVNKIDSVSKPDKKHNDLDYYRDNLVEGITHQSFSRSVALVENHTSDKDIYTDLRRLIKQVDRSFSVFYNADKKALSRNRHIVTSALFLAVNNEKSEQIEFTELLRGVVDHFILNNRLELSNENKDFLVSILDLHRYTQPFLGGRHVFKLDNAEQIEESEKREEVWQSIDQFVKDIQLRNELSDSLQRDGLEIQILTSATTYIKNGDPNDKKTNLNFAKNRLKQTKGLVRKSLKEHNLVNYVEVGYGAALVVQKGDGQKPKPSRQVIIVRGRIGNEEISKDKLNAYLSNFPKGRSQPNLLEYMYFSIYTITTTGYGDILPVSQEAKFIVSMENLVEVFFTVIFFGILISSFQRKGDLLVQEESRKLSERSSQDSHITSEVSPKNKKWPPFFSRGAN